MGTMTFYGTTAYCTNAKFSGCGQVTPKGTDTIPMTAPSATTR